MATVEFLVQIVISQIIIQIPYSAISVVNANAKVIAAAKAKPITIDVQM